MPTTRDVTEVMLDDLTKHLGRGHFGQLPFSRISECCVIAVHCILILVTCTTGTCKQDYSRFFVALACDRRRQPVARRFGSSEVCEY